MSQDFPDFTSAVRLLGIDDNGDLVTVLVDSEGNLNCILLGQGDAGLEVVALTDGKLQAILYGEGDAGPEIVAVDDGNLQALLFGEGDAGPEVIQVDDGRLMALLYGDGVAGLQPIGVDANGRIEIFLLDAESQWGDILRVGNSELAARLGSPKAWDWRGKAIWLSDFRNGISGLLQTSSGTGGAVELDPTRWLSGGYSVKLTGGSSVAQFAALGGSVGPNPGLQSGIEVRFSADATPDYIRLYLQHQYTGGTVIGSVRLDIDADELQVEYPANTWTKRGDSKLYLGNKIFHSFKFVLDTEAEEYVRAMLDDTEYDLSGLTARTAAGVTSPQLTWYVYVYSHSGENDVIYVDSAVLTIDEE